MHFNRFFGWLVGLAITGAVALGHGSMLSPISRVYQVFLENPENPKSAAGRAAVAVAGTQAFYDWHEVNRLAPTYNYQALIPDGQLASAGRAKYAGLDLVRSDWPKTRVNPGPYHMVFDAWVPHDPSFFKAYISRAGWNPAQPIRWSDLEPLDGAQYFRREGNKYVFDTVFPQRTGHHFIYVIWQRIDPAGEVFFSLSDVDFGDGTGYGNPSSGGVVVTPPDGTVAGIVTNIQTAFQVKSDWGTGFSGEVTLINRSPYLLNGWNLTFQLGGQISTFWNVKPGTQQGSTYQVSNETYNQAIAPGQQVTFGFNASPNSAKVGAPHHFTINGLAVNPAEWNGNPPVVTNPPVVVTNNPPVVVTNKPPVVVVTNNPPVVISTNSGPILVEYREDSRWGDGFTGTLRLLNTGKTAVSGWTLAFQLKGGTVSKYWSAVSRSVAGSAYTFGNASWNGTIPAGSSVAFGFQAAAPAGVRPSDFLLNGKAINLQNCGPTTPTTPVTGPVTATLAIKATSNWGSGFTGAATLKHVAGPNLDGWTLSFDFPHRITSIWDAEIVSRSGNRYTIRNASWNRALKAGASLTFGFNAEPGGTIAVPTNISLK